MWEYLDFRVSLLPCEAEKLVEWAYPGGMGWPEPEWCPLIEFHDYVMFSKTNASWDMVDGHFEYRANTQEDLDSFLAWFEASFPKATSA